MAILLGLVALLVGIGSLVCFIIVLIKLFQNEGALKGILGLICSLYTFIWGWMNVDRLNIKSLMMIWTALLLGSIVLNVAASAMGAGGY